MAEKSRSRIVVWTVVGIAVVVVLVFTIVARRNATPRGRDVTAKDVGPFIARIESQLAREQKRIARRRAEYGASYATEFAEIEEHLDNVNTGLAEIQELTDGDQIEEKMTEIKRELGKARDLRKAMGD